MGADPHTPHPRVHRLAVSLRRLALGTSGVRWRGVCAAKGGCREGWCAWSRVAGKWGPFPGRGHEGGVRGVCVVCFFEQRPLGFFGKKGIL